jgi:CRP-like cAMP-binding protein
LLTVIEKVIFLQAVDVFSEVPTDQLAILAQVAEETSVAKDEQLYKSEEASDSMYLVLEGKIRLHRGTTDVLIAQTKEAFGTWALFDDEPRVTDATALEDSRVLRIDKEEFIDVLADNVQITQGVLKAMVRRLRALGRSVQARGS